MTELTTTETAKTTETTAGAGATGANMTVDQACDKVVSMMFPDESVFREWAESPDYQRISEDRRSSAVTVVLLVQALPSNA